jgi:hypothetical protein
MVEASTGAPAQTEAKAKTVAENMANRRVFANPTEAAQYLTASAEAFTDFGDTPLAAPGVDGEGNFDPAIYTDSMDVMVSTLKNKGKVKAIVVAPVPKVNVLLESEAGRAWVDKILHKELNHVAVRHLRDAEDVTNFVDQMPTTIDSYISSERGTGGIMETYDALYKGIDTALASKLPVWSKARFTKGELKKALESKGYASEFYPAVEDYKGNSLFEAALDIGIAAAKRKGLDPTIFERWKNTRATKTYEPGEEEDEEFDLDALTDALIESDEKADAATAETPETEAEAETPADAEAPAA